MCSREYKYFDSFIVLIFLIHDIYNDKVSYNKDLSRIPIRYLLYHIAPFYF